MVDPKCLCKDHLLGEHRELHTLEWCLRRGRKLGKHLSLGQVIPRLLEARHEQLVQEILDRGWKHMSPIREGLPPIAARLPSPCSVSKIAEHSYLDLAERCEKCRSRMDGVAS